MKTTLTQRDIMFRQFQIHKFNRKHMIPAVSMTINVNASEIIKLKNALNISNGNVPHITITHIVMKAAADTLIKYPVLYSFFDGKRIVQNPELMLNIPVDVESHVEYITISCPESKSLSEISSEFSNELHNINSGNGKFMNFLLSINNMSLAGKLIFFLKLNGTFNFLREHYGNFPISNFGSFHIDNGTLALSQPIIAGLCMGAIAPLPGSSEMEKAFLSLTITFDHRAIDGAYAGRFLNDLKTLLENPDKIVADGR